MKKVSFFYCCIDFIEVDAHVWSNSEHCHFVLNESLSFKLISNPKLPLNHFSNTICVLTTFPIRKCTMKGKKNYALSSISIVLCYETKLKCWFVRTDSNGNNVLTISKWECVYSKRIQKQDVWPTLLLHNDRTMKTINRIKFRLKFQALFYSISKFV